MALSKNTEDRLRDELRTTERTSLIEISNKRIAEITESDCRIAHGAVTKMDEIFSTVLDRTESTGDQINEYFARDEMEIGVNILDALVCLPLNISAAGFVDVALDMSRRLSNHLDPELFLGDSVTILSEAGRHEEALAQTEDNLKRFPEAAWIHITAAEAYERAGNPDKSLEIFRRALDVVKDRTFRQDVYERFTEFLKRTGKTAEAKELEEQSRKEDRVRRPSGISMGQIKASPGAVYPGTGDKGKQQKTGRNDPCPCGSGKKFKKCCLGKN
jgi:tetratricopeptide (TPR) repeat protein